MKKIIRNVVEKMVVIPLPIFLVVVAILNYELGSLMAEINGTYSQASEIPKNEFFTKLISTIALYTVLCIFNAIITKISNMKMLNKNYMKWIEKLTYSKVSSITSIGTGGISNAIHTVSQCDKAMVNTVINTLPYIMPFIIINKSEYKEAGILPIIVNIVYIILMVLCNLFVANLKSNKIAAKAGAKLRSCTTDCIYNSKTVKYFNKEDWSIKKQDKLQRETFFDILNLKKGILVSSIFKTLVWIPSLVNVYLCWNNKTVVLFILMSDYALSCISGSIMDFLDVYGDKKANLQIIGKLEKDNANKKPLEKLSVKDIVFKYSEDSKVEFRINDITIEKGKRYCITGKSGFGKSTFIKLLTRTVEPASGQIDAVDTIYMFAESEMFNDTIIENISLGDTTVTKSEVESILQHLEVVLDLDIESDPIGEKGELLSTGQRQRINLARVIVYARRHPGVLVALDEVTSINCINYLTKEFERLGTTLLYVSNKSDYKETNLITDNIYVMRTGNVVTYVQE
jgi:ABC-type bacteriocin/lantibiotic exporter with double-glycine peptidase domain|nr:MAG TPA: ABC-type bacteriocin/lantibiotic exporter [Caudoviricetes sp.]